MTCSFKIRAETCAFFLDYSTCPSASGKAHISPSLRIHDLAGSVETKCFMELPVPFVSDLTGTWDFLSQVIQVLLSQFQLVTAAAPKGTQSKHPPLPFSCS